MQVRLCDTRQVHEHDIGALADLQRSDLVAEEGDLGPVPGRHVKDPVRRGVLHSDTRLAVDLLGEAHLLEEIVVVVDARLVDTDRDRHSPGQHAVDRGHAATEPQV